MKGVSAADAVLWFALWACGLVVGSAVMRLWMAEGIR
jgi:hypothetical protein